MKELLSKTFNATKAGDATCELSNLLTRALVRSTEVEKPTKALEVPEPAWTPNFLKSTGLLESEGTLQSIRSHSSCDLDRCTRDVQENKLLLAFFPMKSSTKHHTTYFHKEGCTICTHVAGHAPTAPPHGLTWGDLYGMIQLLHFVKEETDHAPLLDVLKKTWSGTRAIKLLNKIN